MLIDDKLKNTLKGLGINILLFKSSLDEYEDFSKEEPTFNLQDFERAVLDILDALKFSHNGYIVLDELVSVFETNWASYKEALVFFATYKLLYVYYISFKCCYSLYSPLLKPGECNDYYVVSSGELTEKQIREGIFVQFSAIWKIEKVERIK